MDNLPVLRSLPDEAVEVIYDGVLGRASYWIIHIEPSGAFSIHRQSASSYRYQYLRQDQLELDFASTGYATIGDFADAILASVNIEGLTKAATVNPVSSISDLSAISYRVVPVSE